MNMRTVRSGLLAMTLLAALACGAWTAAAHSGKQVAGGFGGPLPVCTTDTPCPH